MTKQQTLLLTAMLLASTTTFSAQPTLKHQMWQFAFPDSHIPTVIPDKIDRVDPYSDSNITFNEIDSEYNVDVDYDNGYLKISEIDSDIVDRVVVAYTDNNGYHTLFRFNDDPQQTALCVTKVHGQSLHSNRPLDAVLPKDFNFHTFAPQAPAHNPLDYTPYYLDIHFSHGGMTATATLRPFLHPNGVSGKQYIASGDYQSFVGTFIQEHNTIADILASLHDDATFDALINNQPQRINAQERSRIESMLNKIPPDDYADEPYVSDIKSMIYELGRLKKRYELEQYIQYRSVKLGWDANTARFYILSREPNDTPLPSLREYIMNQLTDDEIC